MVSSSQNEMPIKHKIKKLEFPEELVEILNTFNDKILAAQKRDGIPVETGSYDIGKLDSEELFVYTVFLWVSGIDKIIENLNMVLTDLEDLPEKYILFSGSPKSRFYLLVRVYFYEFYRTREIFSQILHGLRLQEKITKDEVRKIRHIYHDSFSQMHEIRNNFVHGTPNFIGKEHFELHLVGTAWDLNQALVSKESGEVWELKDALHSVVKKQVPILFEEGIRMRDTMQNLVFDLVRLLK